MKCNPDCRQDGLRAIGRACQFRDMRDEGDSCKIAEVMEFHFPGIGVFFSQVYAGESAEDVGGRPEENEAKIKENTE